jgi:hypothetical protein
MAATFWGRRELLITMSAGAAAGIIGAAASDAAAQQVKWSEGTEAPSSRRRPMRATATITSTTPSTRSTPRRCCARETPLLRITGPSRSASAPAATSSFSPRPTAPTIA